MVEKFINEYTYSEEMIRESLLAKWYDKNKKVYIAIAAFIIVMLVMAAVKQNWIFLIFVALFIALGAFYELIKKRIVNEDVEKAQELYANGATSIRVEISDVIRAKSASNEKEIQYSDVTKLINSKNLILIVLKGGTTFTLSKDGFISGDAAECLQYLKKKVR